MKNKFKDVLVTFIIILLCTLLSHVLVDFDVRLENLIMIYLIGVVFIVIETKKIFYGIASSFISIITFNYFFTQPIFSFQIYDANYIITIVIFLIVSIITGIIMAKMQKHIEISHYKEKQTKAFYEISKSFLNLSGIEPIIIHSIKSLYKFQNTICEIYYFDKEKNKLVLYRDDQVSKDLHSKLDLANWSYKNSCDCGQHTSFYNNDDWTYCPLHHGNDLLGVYAIYQSEEKKDCVLFVTTLVSQMVMAIEREQLYITQEKNRLEIEKEKLRNNLLRSISHDLRTPLTSVLGASSLIIEKYDQLETSEKMELIKNINMDCQWLIQLVENLLNMTRIQDNRLILTKQKEVVDDIIHEAVRCCESRLQNHQIQVHLPEDIQMVKMDGRLIIQVLINLIDNAIKYTPEDSLIEIRFYKEKNKACFEVKDNGNGIDDSIRETMFESFVTTNAERGDSKRGIGLGLAICKSIINAHDGIIYAKNRVDTHGAIFGFKLPL